MTEEGYCIHCANSEDCKMSCQCLYQVVYACACDTDIFVGSWTAFCLIIASQCRGISKPTNHDLTELIWYTTKAYQRLRLLGVDLSYSICVTGYCDHKFSCNLLQFAGILSMTLIASRWEKAVPIIQTFDDIVSWLARSAQYRLNLCSIRFSHRKTECNIVFLNPRWLKYSLGYKLTNCFRIVYCGL